MKRQEVYNAWKEESNRIEIRENFSEDLLNQIYQYEQKRDKPLFDYQRFVEVISFNLSAQAALVALGAVTGLVRFIFMFAVILGFEG